MEVHCIGVSSQHWKPVRYTIQEQGVSSSHNADIVLRPVIVQLTSVNILMSHCDLY